MRHCDLLLLAIPLAIRVLRCHLVVVPSHCLLEPASTMPRAFMITNKRYVSSQIPRAKHIFPDKHFSQVCNSINQQLANNAVKQDNSNSFIPLEIQLKHKNADAPLNFSFNRKLFHDGTEFSESPLSSKVDSPECVSSSDDSLIDNDSSDRSDDSLKVSHSFTVSNCNFDLGCSIDFE